ncbi:MAG: aryl-sulfate sulfotransferase [Candidatus Sulfotelmatobacter sp.]
MKALFAARTILGVVLCALCVLLAGCGAGSIPSLAAGNISGTQNPLVAVYTIKSECAGQAMVEFGTTTNYGRTTAWYPANGYYQPTSILVAGMTPSTTYHLRGQLQCGSEIVATPDSTFTTGPLPAINFPTLTVTRPNPSVTSPENPGIELVDIDADSDPALFTDRDGKVIWYYPSPQDNYSLATLRILPNGHVIMSWVNGGSGSADSFLQEVDLAGNTIHKLDIKTLSAQLQQHGYPFAGAFHHEILPLPNGHLLVLVNTYKDYTNLLGYPGTTDVQGDMIVDLDQNWNIAWVWDSFDFDGKGLDINRHLNGLPDWTHSNALVYLPQDGNILISMRHQSWVLKLDYNNGAGTGNIIWHLGYEGNKYGAGFALTVDGVPEDDPINWFSFQHFPSLVSQNGSQTTLSIWDNGNDRVLDTISDSNICLISPVGPPCYSRATIFQVDESSMVANLTWADTQPPFGEWGGSINQLGNGNVEFDLNDPEFPPSPALGSYVQEVTQTPTPQVVWQMDMTPVSASAYRAYRVPSLYPGVTWQF